MPRSHRLDALLRPASIAVVGASSRAGTVGAQVLGNLLDGRYAGRLYAVNPHHDTLQGVTCHPHLAALPETPEHVIFGLSDERLEAALDEAIAAGVKAVTIMSSLIVDDEEGAAGAGRTSLRERVQRKLQDAGVLACGGNSMGFYNVRDGVLAGGFDTRRHTPPGNVSLISQSGSGMCGIVDCESRIDFNLVVSTGQELTVGLEDYLDFALELPETAVVGLFLETTRKSDALRAAFAKANRRRVPIVVVKTGRTALAAELTVSHSGALAGSDAAFDAVFDHYGVQRVRDMDELATALILFAQMPDLGPGELVTLHDSGGERQLLVDLAADCRVPLASLTQKTIRQLAAQLDPGLAAVNPLDGWSRGGPHADDDMKRLLATLLDDPNAALAGLIHDRAPDGRIYPEYIDYLKHAHAATGKPLALVASRQGPGSDPVVVPTTKELGFPVLDGVTSFLCGVRCLFGHRDFQRRTQAPARGDRVALCGELSERFGNAVLVAPMAPSGVEMLLGMTRDADFGPLIVFGFGGIYAETLDDVTCALPPFDVATARRLLDGLRLRPLLDGKRGAPPCDLDSLCQAAADFSQMVCALGDAVQEIDINPIIAHADGCIAVDALIVSADRVEDGARRTA